MFSPASKPENKSEAPESSENQPKLPSISLPKGGGAIRGIGEKFAANPVTGTGSLSIPIFTSPGRSGFGPQLSLSYDSGSGNGPFGFGWSLSLPSITRKTDKGLPKYQDSEESDVFILSGAEDLVPVLAESNPPQDDNYDIRRYRPRIEGLFARIERWTDKKTGEVHWRSISRDNITTIYGKTVESRISEPIDKPTDETADEPTNKSRTFSWLICETCDDKGNAVVYEYKPEDSTGIDLGQAHESNRGKPQDNLRNANRYLKRIKYGNRVPLLDDEGHRPKLLSQEQIDNAGWMFEVVFDYGEGHYRTLPLDHTKPESEQHQFIQASESTDGIWSIRPDPFSNYRSGFEVRTYRRCQRVLMFHCFPELASEQVDGNPNPLALPYLVRSTEFDYSDFDYLRAFKVEEELEHKGSTRFVSFIRAATQSGYVRDESQPVLKENGAKYLTYIKKSLPPLEFDYSQAIIQEEIKEIDAKSLENLPYGLDGAQYQWVDLDGEGLSGILTEQAEAWFYKPNLGEGKFGPIEKVTEKPSFAALNSGSQQLLDLAGDGQLDLVLFEGSVQGFYERTSDKRWENFTPFKSIPNVSWKDPNLKFIDLDGDGHADILITENEVFTWYPSLAVEGFGQGERVYQALDEEKGPRLVFYDGSQSIYLADMSGDGLTDLVRIRNGEVCYWPNLGYGYFGAKITMDDSPYFDSFDQFDQKRLRLADIDGSGTTDIIYLKSSGVEIYFNRSGNSFSKVRKLSNFPRIDNLSALQVADLFGNGTACLIWSSPLASDSYQQMRYVDLMGGQKPHLLIRLKNNLGAETKVTYAASTKFYLDDKKKGKPWITRIPFPVHVVERVGTYDRISRNRFVTRYTYHHGYFDGVEREFRGFGMVEQRDTEEIGNFNPEETGNVDPEEADNESTNWDTASFVPPILTRTWFHTGIYIDRDRISNFFAGLMDENDQGEYYREPAWLHNDTEARKRLLDDTVLPGGLTAEEEREACRALKGSMLRQEVYALDGTHKEQHPYTVAEQNFTIRLLEPQAGNRHAVFFTHAREAISFHYERNPEDPRVTHSLTLDVDDFGNVLRSTTVGYPCAEVPERQPEQNETHLTLTLNRFVNRDENPDWRHIGIPVETRTYEVVKPPTTAPLFTWNELNDLSKALIPLDKDEPPLEKTIPYEQWDWRKQWNPTTEPGGLVNGELTNTKLRLIEHIRTLYRPDDLGISKNDSLALLPLGTVNSLALPGETYKLAFIPSLLESVYQRKLLPEQPPEILLPDPSAVLGSKNPDGGGYVDLDSDGKWWIPSGRVFFDTSANEGNPAANAAAELKEATLHFFMGRKFTDPFGHSSIVDYDQMHNLLIVRAKDAVGNIIRAENDYRVLQPRLVIDSNENRSKVVFDALGMVVGVAVMGKEIEPDGKPKGDSLDGFEPDLTQAQIDLLMAKPREPGANPSEGAATQIVYDLLRKATSRIIYDIDRFKRLGEPPFAAVIAREKHNTDLQDDEKSRLQISLSYSDGFGRDIQKKIQAEPGSLTEGGPIINPRWVGSGWTVFNNKGKPIRQYEPFFTDTHRFEFDVRIGVSPVLFYDPLERVVATLHPNHTYEKVIFDPWRQEKWDVNDTIQFPDPDHENVMLTDPSKDPNVGDFFRRLSASEYSPTWYESRKDLPDGSKEKDAAIKAVKHASTPSVAHLDSLGRVFLTIADNGTYGKYPTRVEIDIEGNQREVIDAKFDPATQKGRIVMHYDYDMLGNKIHQASMEAGERWVLNDVTGKSIRAWDSRNHQFRTVYDQLRRPTESYVSEGAGQELLVGRTVYGETQTTPESKNLRGKVYQIFDQAGIVTSDEYDFKGNQLSSHRQLATDYKNSLNWSPTASPIVLEDENFTSSTTYDALNRPIELIAPHRDKPGTKVNIIHPRYNEANLLERIEANLNDSTTATSFVTNIDYNAKGQRTKIVYESRATADRQGVTTTYTYDPLTFRLVHLLTMRNVDAYPDDCPQTPPTDWPGCQLQSLFYTYDPAGNIMYIRDDAQQKIYFREKRVEPSTEYTYDAIYRLIEAKGREHLGQIGGAPEPYSENDQPRIGIEWSANDGRAMGTYFESYIYDAVGNIMAMKHRGCDPAHPGWTRSYEYNEDSQIEPATRKSNRLSSTMVSPNNPQVKQYLYDAHGNMIQMPHLFDHPDPAAPNMHYDYNDQLHQVDLAGSGTAYYVYDSAGQRTRKVVEKSPGLTEERIYLGGFEVFRRRSSTGSVTLERETLHIMDDKQRIALVETRTFDTSNNDPALPQLIRYQLGNHLGSACLELDDQAQIISYEEYYPFGSTSYQAVRSQIDTPKRYRYTGKERDEESGLYYHGARYYATWLGRWESTDPLVFQQPGQADLNVYAYVRGHVLVAIDPSGLDELCPGGTDCSTGSNGKGVERVTPVETEREKKAREVFESAFNKGVEIGKVHGEFFAWANELESMLTRPVEAGGKVSVYSNMSQQEREKLATMIETKYAALPKLPTVSDQETARALREGFREGAQRSYEAAKFESRAVWLAGEIAKAWAMGRASTPTPIGIGGGGDCAACVASRAIGDVLGVETSSSELVRKFGLPQVVITSYKDAEAFARNYFEGLGIRLAAKPGGFVDVAKGGQAGSYAIFLEGGSSGGHVVYGKVTNSGLQVIDDQLGKSWSSLEAASRELGMVARRAYRIESIAIPE